MVNLLYHVIYQLPLLTKFNEIGYIQLHPATAIFSHDRPSKKVGSGPREQALGSLPSSQGGGIFSDCGSASRLWGSSSWGAKSYGKNGKMKLSPFGKWMILWKMLLYSYSLAMFLIPFHELSSGLQEQQRENWGVKHQNVGMKHQHKSKCGFLAN